MNRNQIESFTARWLAAVCAGNSQEFEHLTAETSIDTGTGLATSRAAFQERARAVFAAFEALEGRVTDLVIDGDRIAWRWVLTGRQRATFLGQAPTNAQQKRLVGVNFQRLTGGVVTEHYTLLDTTDFLKQQASG